MRVEMLVLGVGLGLATDGLMCNESMILGIK